MSESIHITAIDWALANGYVLSVRDYSENDFDLIRSRDRADIIDATEGTELPNVYISKPLPGRGKEPTRYRRIAVFSVIDEGQPDETINDYQAKPGGEFDKFMDREFSLRNGGEA